MVGHASLRGQRGHRDDREGLRRRLPPLRPGHSRRHRRRETLERGERLLVQLRREPARRRGGRGGAACHRRERPRRECTRRRGRDD
jgi:hypothetical protein